MAGESMDPAGRPGNTVIDHPNAARQNAEEITTRDDGIDMHKGPTLTVKE